MTEPVRNLVLDIAKDLINNDRNSTYGDPTEDFTRTSQMVTAVLGRKIDPHEIAIIMICVKLSRLHSSPRFMDSWVDICGYSALGFEVAKNGE
jgi:hypothetical protein